MCLELDGSDPPISTLPTWKDLVALAGGPERLLRQLPREFQLQPTSITHQSVPVGDDGWTGSLWNCVLSLREYQEGELQRDIRVAVTLRGPDFVADGLPERFVLNVPPDASIAPFKELNIAGEIIRINEGADARFRAVLTGSAALDGLEERLEDTSTLTGLPDLAELFESAQATPAEPVGVSVEKKCLPVTAGGNTINMCHQRVCYTAPDGVTRVCRWDPIPGTAGCPGDCRR